jgi:hypothetical protein
VSKQNGNALDVVLIGGSLIEHMEGKELGVTHSRLKRYEDAFITRFSRLGGGKIDGMALGIAGDRCSHLLYRLHNGQQLLSEKFAPKVWWIDIGTQDWKLGASPSSIVAGIMAIVREIRSVHGKAQIVVNSLLPQEGPLNDSIEHVNQLLGCYVHSQSLFDQDEDLRMFLRQDSNNPTRDHRRRLHFFNATNIFVERQNDGSYQINPNLLDPDGNEPNYYGEFEWGEKIVETVLELIHDSDV